LLVCFISGMEGQPTARHAVTNLARILLTGSLKLAAVVIATSILQHKSGIHS